MSRERPEHIAWIDLETTGTDPDADEIIEIGLVITNYALEPVERRTWTVYPKEAGKLLRMDDVVVDMHARSGLLADVLKLRSSSTLYPNINGVDNHVSRLLDGYLDSEIGAIPLGGSGVHFDRAFIKRHMPRTEERLPYWHYDIGPVRRLLRLAGVETDRNERASLTHRALEDIEDHIAEAREYASLFASLVAVPE